MIDGVFRLIEQAQGAIFENALQPLLYQCGLMDWSEEAFDGVGFALFGAIEITLAYILFRPLEWWRPVEQWSARRAVRTDVVYTLVHRLGLVPAMLFLLLTPIGAMIDGYLRFRGYIPPTVEQFFPPLRAWPFATLLIYVVLLDFGEYWRHRLQHRVSWWWALHSLHHDQRQMTLWTDDRNHVLDDVLAAVWSGTVALLIGVAPAEFPLVMIAFRLVENLSHSNLRHGFGRLGTHLVVGPQYHRLHHSIAHAGPPFDRPRGCNFAVILPLWDVIFGTCRRDAAFPATGVADLDGGVIHSGYLRHQLEGFRRLGAELRHFLDRRRPGFAAALPGD
ncbi:MAG TPA: sterol desaturase family protein [Stellaceae bacterium]|jgi:sterol desaturase/sphingolipid hydroxylase (fatty acid hydroxylase superfamily)|nr:sterol desaturase family protein [Stellaceae bacterium]